MDELEIKGKKYISSKRASELTGYAKDYVGQLARAKKVPATRVGRAWYVEASAITALAGVTPEASHTSVEKEESAYNGSEAHSEGDALSARHFPAPLYSLQKLHTSGIETDHFKTWRAIEYLADDMDLLPQVAVKKSSGQIHIHRKRENPLKNIPLSEEKMQKGMGIDGMALPQGKVKVQHQELPHQPTPHIRRTLKAPYALLAGIALVLVVSTGFIGGSFVPTSWSFNSLSQTASGAAFFEGFDVVVESFILIFSNGITLLADFFFILLASLGDFFDVGFIFILDLFNLG